MKFKKLIALALAAALLGQSAHAGEYATNVGGCGYTECMETPCLAPAIALSTIALVAIIAVAIQNHHHQGHGHAHNE